MDVLRANNQDVRLKQAVVVPVPRYVVVGILNSAEDAPKWQRDLIRMEIVEGSANEPGAKARLHYRERGKSYVMEDELMACEPGRRWFSRVSGNGMTIYVETLLKDVEGGTELAMTWRGTPDAVLARAVFWLMRPFVKRRMRSDLDRLVALARTKV